MTADYPLFSYDPFDHYWLRANGQLYSSARNIEVGDDDADYQAWLAVGNQPTMYPNDSTGVESIEELDKVLKPYGLRASPLTEEDLREAAEVEAVAILNYRMHRDMAQTADLTDPEISLMARAGLLPEWTPGVKYVKDERISRLGQAYIIVAVEVVAQEHQPPESTGMYAIYRPVGAAEEDGSLAHPYVLVVGMEGIVGKYYFYNDSIWRCEMALPNIFSHYVPGSPGMDAFWTLIS